MQTSLSDVELLVWLGLGVIVSGGTRDELPFPVFVKWLCCECILYRKFTMRFFSLLGLLRSFYVSIGSGC